jgi:transcription initiation factor IIE alpha subunit
MIKNAANGLTANEIAAATNFKLNSVRGTLWTLGNEGLIVKRGGRLYWKAKSSSPEGETEAVRASAHH